MPKQTPLVERSMDLRAALREARRAAAPIWEQAIATGDWHTVAEAKALADDLKALEKLSNRVFRAIEAASACPDVAGRELNHGRAA